MAVSVDGLPSYLISWKWSSIASPFLAHHRYASLYLYCRPAIALNQYLIEIYLFMKILFSKHIAK